MKTSQFLKLLQQPGRTNFAAVASSTLGLTTLIPRTLQRIAAEIDIHVYSAGSLTKEKVRQIGREAMMAPRGSSDLTHFLIYDLQHIAVQSVGPLLKVVEDAQYGRFIFQTQKQVRKVSTLLSRASVVRLPFLKEQVVLGNMKELKLDAATAQRLKLYDGTLGGTIESLGMKDTLVAMQREMKAGARGLVTLLSEEYTNSLVFDRAVYDKISKAERDYLARHDDLARRKVVLYLVTQRGG